VVQGFHLKTSSLSPILKGLPRDGLNFAMVYLKFLCGRSE